MFDDLPHISSIKDAKNNLLVNKRSLSNNVPDIDVQDMLVQSNIKQNIDDDDGDDGVHWLWGSVRRIRRSLDKFLGTDTSVPSQHIDDSAIEINNNNKKVHRTKKDHHNTHGLGNKKNSTGHKLRKANKHGKKQISGNKQRGDRTAVKLKRNQNKLNRPKRQHDDDNGDEAYEDDNEDGEEEELNNEINGSGGQHLPSSPYYDNEIDGNQKLEKLCKLLIVIVINFH